MTKEGMQQRKGVHSPNEELAVSRPKTETDMQQHKGLHEDDTPISYAEKKAITDQQNGVDTWANRKLQEYQDRPRSQWSDYGWYDSSGILHANTWNLGTNEWNKPDDRQDYIISQFLGYNPNDPTTYRDTYIDGTKHRYNAPYTEERKDVQELAKLFTDMGFGYGDYTSLGYDNASDYYLAQLDQIADSNSLDLSSDADLETAQAIFDAMATMSNVDWIVDRAKEIPKEQAASNAQRQEALDNRFSDVPWWGSDTEYLYPSYDFASIFDARQEAAERATAARSAWFGPYDEEEYYEKHPAARAASPYSGTNIEDTYLQGWNSAELPDDAIWWEYAPGSTWWSRPEIMELFGIKGQTDSPAYGY